MRCRGSRSLALGWIFLLTAMAALAAEKTPPTFGIPNATFPRPGVMVAGQPTGEQLQLLAEEGGYHAVIDLRSPEEPHGFDEPAAARDNGLAYINIPVSPAALDQATIDRFLAAMRTVRPPVLIHCGTGSRSGALLYAWLVLEKKEPPARALAEAKAAGLRSPELIEKVQQLVGERQGR